MQPLIIKLDEKMPNGVTCGHDGESFIFVIDGGFALSLEGREIHLEKGDGIYLKEGTEYRFRSKEGSGATLLQVRG
jgi:glyoxylate utilization-related uncharacterized protein